MLAVGWLYSGIQLAYGQEEHPYELKVVSENDVYRWTYHDGYYTNGLYFTYTYLPRRLNQRLQPTQKLTKVISTYQMGQAMFTPELVDDVTPTEIDRPYAGYLFLQKGFTFFYRNGHVLTTSLSVGTIGKASLAQAAQTFIHKTLDFLPPRGWVNQVKDEVGVNAQIQYGYDFIPTGSKWLDVHGTSQVTLGNTFTNASAGVLVQVGLFNRPEQSAMYGARVNRLNHEQPQAAEFYVFFYPQYQYQVYNATVEGGLFRQDKGPVLGEINREVYMQELGFVFAQNRWTAMVTYWLKHREAKAMHTVEKYGGFTFAYRFGVVQSH